MSFASQGEAKCFDLLEEMEKAGKVSNLRAQQTVRLTDAGIGYRVDFVLFDEETGVDVYVEFKGFETDVWLLKKKLWKFYGPGKLQIFKSRGGKIVLTEEIVPGLR